MSCPEGIQLIDACIPTVIQVVTPGPPGPAGPQGPAGSGSGSTTLAALTDVNVSAKVNKSLLYYDSVSGKWLGDSIQTITEVTNGGNF